MNLVIAILAALLVLAGCSTTHVESDAWRRARESTAEEERQWTNGMAWPSDASSREIVMNLDMQITARTDKG